MCRLSSEFQGEINGDLAFLHFDSETMITMLISSDPGKTGRKEQHIPLA